MAIPSPGYLLRAAVSCALQAPSTHNTQPWRFRIRGPKLELWLDTSRLLGVIDPLRRQATISLGCALYNARVAIRAAGFAAKVTLLPHSEHPDLMAVVELGLPREATDVDRHLLAAIPNRHTNRRPFQVRPVSEFQADALAHAAGAERTRMIRLTPDQKLVVAALVAECDRRRFAEPAYRDELKAWLAPSTSFRRDGVPFTEKEYGASGRHAVEEALRDRRLGEEVAELEIDRVLGAPLVVVFATEANDDVDWLDCGQALEAVLLRACTLGMSAAFVDQLLEFEDLHHDVADLIGGGLVPQLVVRLGHADRIERVAPRRRLGDVLDESDWLPETASYAVGD